MIMFSATIILSWKFDDGTSSGDKLPVTHQLPFLNLSKCQTANFFCVLKIRLVLLVSLADLLNAVCHLWAESC